MPTRASHRHALALALLLTAIPSLAATTAQTIPDTQLNGLIWRLVGPFRAGWGTMAAGIPDQPDTFYFGAAGGGVWKTTDAGNTWQPMSDGEPERNLRRQRPTRAALRHCRRQRSLQNHRRRRALAERRP